MTEQQLESETQAESEKTGAPAPDKASKMLVRLVGTFGAIYAGWAGLAIGFAIFGAFYEKDSIGALGTFGDSFGVLNALFAGAALFFVAFTIVQQQELIKQGQKQLDVQQEELKQNTAELRNQREEMEIQNRYLAKQAIQNQFFQLLASWRKLAQENKTELLPNGEAFFDQFVDECRQYASKNTDGNTARYETRSPETLIGECFVNTVTTNRCIEFIARYYDMLYEIMRLIDNEKYPEPGTEEKPLTLSEYDRRGFMNIIRSQMSQGEMISLFYYVYSEFASPVMDDMVKDYLLLERLQIPGWFANAGWLEKVEEYMS